MVANKKLKMMTNYKTTSTKSSRPRFREVLIIGFSLRKIVFWIDGRLREVIAYGRAEEAKPYLPN